MVEPMAVVGLEGRVGRDEVGQIDRREPLQAVAEPIAHGVAALLEQRTDPTGQMADRPGANEPFNVQASFEAGIFEVQHDQPLSDVLEPILPPVGNTCTSLKVLGWIVMDIH
jgi:hypothetical protein